MTGTFDIQNFFVRYLLPLIGCIGAAFATVYIMSEVNPLGAALRCISLIFFAMAVVAPRAGFIILLGLCGYSDLLKRLLIFWSELSFDQLSYVLAVAPLVVTGLIIALVTRWAFHTVQITRRDFIMGVFVIVAIALSFLLAWKEKHEFLGSAKDAVNSGLYVAMMPIAAKFLTGRDDVLKLFRVATVLFLPIAVYGIVQSIFGFADFELEYLKTGLTVIVFEGVPRPFSTLNSAGAMGDTTALMAILSLVPYTTTREHELPLKPLFFPLLFAAGYLAACVLFGVQFSFTVAATGLLSALIPFVFIAGEGLSIGGRVVPLLFFALYSAACVCSLVRHSYFMLLAGLIGIFCFRSIWRTRLFYAVGAVLVLALVLSASYLLGNLAAWDPAAKADSEFSERALSIQTYAERLKGFSNLTGSWDMYSLFGLPADQKSSATTYHHDPISGILVDYGIVVLLAVVGGFVWMLYYAHRQVLALPEGVSRLLGVMLLSMMFAVLASHLLFYGVLSTFPVNAFFWLFTGSLFCVIGKGSETPSPEVALPDSQREPTARWAMPLGVQGDHRAGSRVTRQR